MAVLLVTSMFAFCGGCSKSEKAQPAPQVGGVTVDMPKLQKAMEGNNNPEVRSQMNQVAFGFRYGDYPKALMALDQLSTNPNVSEAEKKVVNEVIEQVKKVAQNAPAPAQ